MPTIPSGKYQLKSLHDEIALFDRKLSYTQTFAEFSNAEERGTAVAKLTSKRGLLVRRAQQMIDEGIEFHEKDRPKSLRPEPAADQTVSPMTATTAVEAETETDAPAPSDPIPSPYAGTALDYQTNLLAYKKRGKARVN